MLAQAKLVSVSASHSGRSSGAKLGSRDLEFPDEEPHQPGGEARGQAVPAVHRFGLPGREGDVPDVEFFEAEAVAADVAVELGVDGREGEEAGLNSHSLHPRISCPACSI